MLTIVYPFCLADYPLAIENARWIAELGTVEAHQCLVVHDKLVPMEDGQAIVDTLKPAFRKVAHMPLRETLHGIRGMNLLFRRTARQIAATNAGPFLWLNPDAIPIRKGWLDAIEAAYRMLPKGKTFLGHHLQGAIPFMGQIGVYPQDCEVHAPGLVGADQNPFFVNGAPGVVPKMGHTDLIKDQRDEPNTEGDVSTAILHGTTGCKSGEVIKALRSFPMMDALPIVAVPAQSAQETGPQRFSVPTDPITQDRAASQAISRAGSEGFAEPDVEVAPVIPRVKPPTVNPVALNREGNGIEMTPEIAKAGIAVAGKMREIFGEPKSFPVESLSVSALAAELAKRKAASVEAKAEVNKALRDAGFRLAGTQPKK